MSRRTVIISSTLLLAIILAVSWTRGLQQYQAKRREGRAIAVGLNAQFMADPRFNKVRVLGYSVRGGLPWIEGKFEVIGSVPTRKDFIDLVGIVRSVGPPGRLTLKVAIIAPIAAPKVRTR